MTTSRDSVIRDPFHCESDPIRYHKGKRYAWYIENILSLQDLHLH